MVTDLWTFDSLIGLMGKLNFGPQNPEFWGAKGVHRSDMGSLGPVASICATPTNRQTDRGMEGRMDSRQMLEYVMSFDD